MQAKDLPNGYFYKTSNDSIRGIKHNDTMYYNTRGSLNVKHCTDDYTAFNPHIHEIETILETTQNFSGKESYMPKTTLTINEVLSVFPKLRDAAEREYPQHTGYVKASTLPEFTVVKVHGYNGYFAIVNNKVVGIGLVTQFDDAWVKPV